MMYEIVNPDNLFYSKNSKLVNDFMDFSSKNLGFSKPVTIDFIEDDGAGQDPLGKTAHYNPQEMSIVVYTTNRHPKDILRSLSHELVHHCQNCEERIPSNSSTKEGYAQTDETMRSLESEAYQKGNIMNFRDFEDQYKMKESKKQINKHKPAKYGLKTPVTEDVYVLRSEEKKAMGSPAGAALYLRLQNKSRFVTAGEAKIVEKSVQYWLEQAKNNPQIAKEFIFTYKEEGGALRGPAPFFQARFSVFNPDFSNSDVKAINRNLVALAKLAQNPADGSDAGGTGGFTPAGSTGAGFTPAGSTGAGQTGVSAAPAKKRRRRKGPHIRRLKRALVDFGQRLNNLNDIFDRETQESINAVRDRWPKAPGRKPNFNASVKAFTDWLVANKDIGKNVKPAPAKKTPSPAGGPPSPTKNRAIDDILSKDAQFKKEEKELEKLYYTILDMPGGDNKTKARNDYLKRISDFRRRKKEFYRGKRNQKLDEAEVSQKDKKRPLRENQKADRSGMLSRILTERLLGRNVKIKI